MASEPDRAAVVIAEQICAQAAVSLAVRAAFVVAAPDNSLDAVSLPVRAAVVMAATASCLETDSFSVRAVIAEVEPVSSQVVVSRPPRFGEVAADPMRPRSFDTAPDSAERVETAPSAGLILPASPAKMDATLAVAPRILVLVSLTAAVALVDIVPAKPRIPKA